MCSQLKRNVFERHAPRPVRLGWGWIAAITLFMQFQAGMLLGEPFYTISGWIEPAPAAYRIYGDYVVRNDPLDRVRSILVDPDHHLVKNLPDRSEITVVMTQPRGPLDEPVFRIARQEAAKSADYQPDAVGSQGWTAQSGELYASEMNVLPRIASFTGDFYQDADGDGAPDGKDAFPSRPDEWADTDHDGTGNNADDDDDNDGMNDYYEQQNGLNALVADADKDADGDGMSNGDEAVAGTSANNGSSVLRLTLAVNPQTQIVTLRWPALATRVYTIERAFSPTGPWQVLTGGINPPTDGVTSYNINIPTSQVIFVRTTVRIR